MNKKPETEEANFIPSQCQPGSLEYHDSICCYCIQRLPGYIQSRYLRCLLAKLIPVRSRRILQSSRTSISYSEGRGAESRGSGVERERRREKAELRESGMIKKEWVERKQGQERGEEKEYGLGKDETGSRSDKKQGQERAVKKRRRGNGRGRVNII